MSKVQLIPALCAIYILHHYLFPQKQLAPIFILMEDEKARFDAYIKQNKRTTYMKRCSESEIITITSEQHGVAVVDINEDPENDKLLKCSIKKKNIA